MKKIRLSAAALLLAALAACAAPPTGESNPPAESADGTASPAAELESEDIAFLASGIRRDDPLLTVDGEPIPAEEYLYYLVNAVSVWKQLGRLNDDTAWEETLNGIPAVEVLKNDALDTAKLYRIIRTKAEQAGVSLTENDRMELETQNATLIAQLGGEKQFQLWLESNCISREGFERINETYYLNWGLQKTMEGTETFLEEQGIYAARHILLATRRQKEDGSYEEYSEEEKAAVLERMTGLREEIVSAGDVEAAFNERMNAYSEDTRNEDGTLASPEGYTYVYPGEMASEFEAAAKSLKVGEISEPVKTEFGYHLILRITPDEETAKAEKLTWETNQWLEQAEVVPTKAYEELAPKDFCDKLSEIVAERVKKAFPEGLSAG